MVLVSCGSNLRNNKTMLYSTKNLKKLEIEDPSSFLATTADYQTRPIAPNSVLIGYLIDGYEPTDGQFDEMSHIAISFLQAIDSSGAISMTSGWENLDKVIAAAHAKNVKVIISFGGGGFKVTSELMGIKENRQNLIKNIILFMKKHNLDGFDCDWEPSWIDNKLEMETINNAITHYYITFIKEFRKALDNEFGKGAKTFSAAVLNGNSIWYSSKKQISHFPKNGWWHYLDWVSLMNYDNALGREHATFDSVFGPDGSVAYWTRFGIPQAKIVTGIPFYARAGWGEEWLSYKDIVEMNPEIDAAVDFIVHSKNYFGKKEYGFNGTETIIRKVLEGKKLNLPGVMFWQLAGDLPVSHQKSLLNAISKELKK